MKFCSQNDLQIKTDKFFYQNKSLEGGSTNSDPEFKKQIEASIDKRIAELESLNNETANQLKEFKSTFLEALTSGGDNPETKEIENYLSDEKLEHEEIWDMILNDEKFGNAIDKIDMPVFELLGTNRETTIKSPEFLINKETIEFTLPLGSSEKIITNFQKCFSQIENSSVKELITPTTQFEAFGGARITFNVEKNGENIPYLATPNGLFQITENPNQEDLKIWVKESMKLYKAKRKRDNELWDKYGDEYEDIIKAKNISFETPEIKKQEEVVSALREKAENTYMIDVKTTEKVVMKEKNPLYKHSFSLSFTNKEGQKHQEKIYEDNNFYSEKTFSLEDQKITEENIFYPSGKMEFNHLYDENGEKVFSIQYRENGVIKSQKDFVEGSYNFFDTDGETKRYGYKKEDESDIWRGVIFYEGDKYLGTIDMEREKNPEMTPEEYIQMLAEKLDTPEKINDYLSACFEYIVDGVPVENLLYGKDNLAKGMFGEITQTAAESAIRTKEGQVYGDCDDYAQFAKELLSLQGKNAHVVVIPGHAICLWAEQSNDGKFHAHTLGTFGFDHNGNNINIYEENINEERKQGYDTLNEALDSILQKYKSSGLGFEGDEEVSIDKYIKIARPPSGFHTGMYPISVLVDTEVSKNLETFYDDEIKISKEAREQLIVPLIEKYPNEVLYYEQLSKLWGPQKREAQNTNAKSLQYAKKAIDLKSQATSLYESFISSNASLDEKIDVFNKASEYFPDSDFLSELKSGIKPTEIKQWEAFLLKLIEKEQFPERFYYEIIDTRIKQNRNKEALSFLEKNKEAFHDYDYEEYFFRLCKKEAPRRGIRMYKKKLKEAPNDIRLQKKLAQMYYSTDKFKTKGEQMLMDITSQNPDNGWEYFDVFDMYLDAGEKEKAIKYFQKNIDSLNPSLGIAMARQLEKKKLVYKTYEHYIEKNPKNIELYIDYKIYCDEVGDTDQAKVVVEKMKEIQN